MSGACLTRRDVVLDEPRDAYFYVLGFLETFFYRKGSLWHLLQMIRSRRAKATALLVQSPSFEGLSPQPTPPPTVARSAFHSYHRGSGPVRTRGSGSRRALGRPV